MRKSKCWVTVTAVFSLLASITMSGDTRAQTVNGETLKKSLVRVSVSGGGGGRGTARLTGFVWPDAEHVVTALHGMRLGNNVRITVNWGGANSAQGQGGWNATVEKVLPKADLVLLKVDMGRVNFPWTPISAAGAARYGEKVYAMGYPMTATAWRMMSLSVTRTQTNTLADVPGAQALGDMGIPSPSIEILHFESNSLLPGYSGAPIVNVQGELVAIGDGGVDQGDKNLSWGIPAKFLSELTTSNETALPASLNKTPQHYAAEEPPRTNETVAHGDKTYSAEQYIEQRSDEVSFGEFDFYYTKTRTMNELLRTADEGYYMAEINEDLAETGIDAGNFAYDLYQDANYGIVIAAPIGTMLYVQEDLLVADFGDPYLNQNYKLVFGYQREQPTAEDMALLSSESSLAYGLKEILEVELAPQGLMLEPDAEETRLTQKPGGGTGTVGYNVKSAGYYDSPTLAYIFGKLALRSDVGLVALTTLSNYTSESELLMEQCFEYGYDCGTIDPYSQCGQVCIAVRQWWHIITSCHLTSFID